MIQGILFDMDGTLVDSEPYYYVRKRNYLISCNLPHNDELLQQYIGRDMRDFFAYICDGDKKLQQSYIKDYHEFILEHPLDYTTMIFPEVKEVLQACIDKGYSLALVSSSPWGNIHAMLEQCQLASFFKVVISGSDVPKAKPNPQVYIEAMKRISLVPSQCIVVEDSYSGILAGSSAGCRVIVRGKLPLEYGANTSIYCMDNLKELLPFLSEFSE